MSQSVLKYKSTDSIVHSSNVRVSNMSSAASLHQMDKHQEKKRWATSMYQRRVFSRKRSSYTWAWPIVHQSILRSWFTVQRGWQAYVSSCDNPRRYSRAELISNSRQRKRWGAENIPWRPKSRSEYVLSRGLLTFDSNPSLNWTSIH